MAKFSIGLVNPTVNLFGQNFWLGKYVMYANSYVSVWKLIYIAVVIKLKASINGKLCVHSLLIKNTWMGRMLL